MDGKILVGLVVGVLLIALGFLICYLVFGRSSAELDRQIERLESNLQEARNANIGLREQLTEAEATSQKLETGLAEAEAINREIREEADRLERGIGDLEQSISGSLDMVSGIGGSIDEIYAVLDEIIRFLEAYSN